MRAFERADRAVDIAKGNGRDQVCSFATLVAAGHLEVKHESGDIELV